MARNISIQIIPAHCKQCGICAALCPRKVLAQKLGEPPEVARPADCSGCRLCQMRCPDFAIEVEVEPA